jgi:ATP-dependent DNA ligase
MAPVCRLWTADFRSHPGGHRRRTRVQLVYYAFDLLHLDGWDISGLQLIERKALLEPLLAQCNGHETGDGELILKHAGKLGFEGVVSKTAASGVPAAFLTPPACLAR